MIMRHYLNIGLICVFCFNVFFPRINEYCISVEICVSFFVKSEDILTIPSDSVATIRSAYSTMPFRRGGIFFAPI